MQLYQVLLFIDLYSDLLIWIPNIYQSNGTIPLTTINISDTTNPYIGTNNIKITYEQHSNFIQLKLPSSVVNNNKLTILSIYIDPLES
jgi:hypothetical protein